MTSSDKYYERKVFECKRCGDQYQTPGTAELCWKKDKLMEVLEEVENHKALYLQDVIEDIERMVEEGKYDYDN